MGSGPRRRQRRRRVPGPVASSASGGRGRKRGGQPPHRWIDDDDDDNEQQLFDHHRVLVDVENNDTLTDDHRAAQAEHETAGKRAETAAPLQGPCGHRVRDEQFQQERVVGRRGEAFRAAAASSRRGGSLQTESPQRVGQRLFR